MIALNSPLKPDLKKLNKYLEQINDRGWYSNFGPLHQELTERLEEYLGVKNLLLIANGTLALQVAARALGTESVISTPFSFVATVSAFKWQRDEVAFTDVDRASYNLCPAGVLHAFEKGSKADTVVATHVYGNPCDVDALEKLSKEKSFNVIYDAAHAFGVKLDGESILKYGDASILSFHATKVFHTIEGGAAIFKDEVNYEKAKNIINFGIESGRGVTGNGINAKLNEYQAAVGLVNLDEIDRVLEYREELFYIFREGLKDVVEIPKWHPKANANGAYMPIWLESSEQLEQVIKRLAENNIGSRHYFSPSLDKVFVDNFNYGTKHSIEISDGILCLPMHSYLLVEDVWNIIDIVKRALK